MNNPPSIFKKIALISAFFAGVLVISTAQATPTSFTGSYSQNFDSALAGSSTTMPPGFRSMVIAGGNATYVAGTPISTAGIASATVSGTQTLTVWNAGSAVASSGTALFNIGSFGNLNDRALGTDPTGTAANVIELSLTNNTGYSLLGVTFSYDDKCLTNGSAGTEQSELPGYAFFYSTTGGTTAGEWTQVPALTLGNYTQGTTMSSGNVNLTFATPLTNNGIMYFRWADDNNVACSPDQEIAIDNISIPSYTPVADPAIFSQPVSMAVSPGTMATFSVTASGTAPFGYQWQATNNATGFFTNLVNGGNVAGADTNILSLANVTAAQALNYRVIITNVNGAVTSSVVSLTMLPFGGTSLSISNASFEFPAQASTHTFMQTLDGTPATSTYLPGWTNVSTGGGIFSTIYNGAGITNTDGSQVVEAFSVPGSSYSGQGILYQVLTNTWIAGAQYTLTVRAGVGTGTVAEFGDTISLDNLSASGSTLTQLATTTIPNTSSGLANYTVYYTATGSEGGMGKVVVAFHVPGQSGSNPRMWVDKFALAIVNTTPLITTQPASQTNAINGTTQFSVTAAGNAPLSYQWQATNSGSGGFTNLANGGPISGATSNVLTISPVDASWALAYQVVVTNSYGAVTSSPAATLTVLTIPAITTQPVSQTVLSGSTVTFNVGAAGVGTLDYQWRANGGTGYTNITNGGIISGANTSTLTLSGVSANWGLSYQVIVTNANGAITSSPAATLTVLPAIVLINGDFGTSTIQSGPAVLGSPGNYWNAISSASISPITNATGSALSGVGLTLANAGQLYVDAAGTAMDAATTPLMTDYAFGYATAGYTPTVTVSLTGLAPYMNSSFTLVIYAAGDNSGQGGSLTVQGAAGGNTASTLTTIATSRQISAGLGVAYNTFTGILTNGTLTFTSTELSGQAFTDINGFQLQLGPNSPPNAPVVVSPAANATGVTNHPVLNVAVSDPDTNNLTVTFYGRTANVTPDFTVIALPDTQFYSQSYPYVFKSQTDWILTNHATLNIAYVTQLGDCVQSGDNSGDNTEWRNATNALYTLENPLTTLLANGIPYGVAVGNHDQSPEGDATGTTTFYNQYFGTNHFLPYNYYGGNYGTNGNNFYELFSAGGLDFITVYLEYNTALTSTNAPVFTWANNLLHSYANRRAIVVSHYIINSYTAGSTFGPQGQAVYDALKGNTNLSLMLCGHINPNGEGRRTDVYGGNTIQTLLSDYQDLTSGGNGWLRIYTFSPKNNVIHAQTYSPYLDSYQTGANSQFDVPYAMTPTNPFTIIGTVTGVPSGGNALKTWFGLTTNTAYEWYAAVSDGQITAVGPVSRFTTASSFPAIPPTVTLTSPANNAGYSGLSSIAITAAAADADGMVTNVAFYQNAVKLADVATSPFSYNWAGVAAGSYALQAVATDDEGLMTTSSIVNVSVTNSLAVQILQQAKTVFVIAMENHNFTQPSPGSSPQQIYANSAASYINSLLTPGNSNAAQVSYATAYYNSGVGVHPSEPNYIWAEGGTDFGYHTDNDPTPANGNVFNAPHLTRQLTAVGIPWKNYQEDLQLSTSPTNSASGTSGTTINPYYGTGDYAYAVKHNPPAFYTDTQTQNVFAFTNFLRDLANRAVGRYNWITPNLYNDQHSPLASGFTYHGVPYTGDQAAIAQGDNFLATLVPQIMASAAYQDHGIIILWWDEAEGGDTASYAIPEIVLSPMAKGNAYASGVELNHSSDLKTMEEIFGLGFLTNAIPAGETKASGSGYNNVATVNDLSDLFRGIAGLGVQQSGTTLTNGGSAAAFGSVTVGASVTNMVTLTNTGLGTLTLSNLVVSGAQAGDYRVGGIALPALVAAGGSTTFNLVFSPANCGASAATLLITNNDPWNNPFTMLLTGTGDAAPVIFSQPGSQTNNAGTSASFSVGATACTALNYQWYFGTNVLAGETNSSLSIAPVGPTNVGYYHVVVSSSGGNTNSDLASLTVIFQAPNVVGGQMMLGAGGFYLTFSGPAGQTYQVKASDQLTTPRSAWTVIGNGTFGSTNVIFTDTDAANHPHRFYSIESP